jgi:TonB-dependent starch-binding outer membrane protein SusC
MRNTLTLNLTAKWMQCLALLLILAVIPVLEINAGIIKANTGLQQEKTITGTVSDNSGAPLPGVTVVVKGTSTGTITDIDGNFTIKVSGNEAVLEIKFLGYDTQEITVGEQTSIQIKLAESFQAMDEVVVIGYGTQKKSDLTGAVASISSKEILSMPVTRTDEALEGRAAGVNVTATSGMPGSSRTIQIRGVS